jgi:hypothetical protein
MGKKVGITNWGFVILPQGFKESQIPYLVEKIKEVMRTPSSTDIFIAVDQINDLLVDQLTTDINEMIAKFGRPSLIGEEVWNKQFTIAFLKGLQSEDSAVRAVGKKVVERIAKASVEQQIFLMNVGLPNLQKLCITLATSFI